MIRKKTAYVVSALQIQCRVKDMRPQLSHQTQICNTIHQYPFQKRWGLFCEPGTGKTKTALDISNLIQSNFDHIFIFAPKGLLKTWEKEIEIEGYFSPDFYTLIPYSMVSLKKVEALEITDRSMIILDESHFIKNPSSKRTKFFTKLLKKINPYVLSLTGTPDPRNILDWWIQCYILSAWTGGMELNYQAFSHAYATWKDMITGTGIQFKKFLGEKKGSRDLLMQGFRNKAFFIRKQDVLDLPEKVYEIKYYGLTPEQKRYIKQLKEDALAQVEHTQEYITASMHNFLAVCSGFVRAKFDANAVEYQEPKLIEFKQNPKLELLETIIESMDDRQLIIFCSYHKEMEMISALLEKMKITFTTRSGRLSVENNEKSLKSFVDGDFQVLLATVQSTSVGLTMVNCDTVIYFNNTYDLMHRLQSEDRIHRIGQKNTCVYIDLVAENAPDQLLLENLQMKKSNSEETFKAFLSRL
jgi:SNF2 family DNA or RNA helicase